MIIDVKNLGWNYKNPCLFHLWGHSSSKIWLLSNTQQLVLHEWCNHTIEAYRERNWLSEYCQVKLSWPSWHFLRCRISSVEIPKEPLKCFTNKEVNHYLVTTFSVNNTQISQMEHQRWLLLHLEIVTDLLPLATHCHILNPFHLCYPHSKIWLLSNTKQPSLSVTYRFVTYTCLSLIPYAGYFHGKLIFAIFVVHLGVTKFPPTKITRYTVCVHVYHWSVSRSEHQTMYLDVPSTPGTTPGRDSYAGGGVSWISIPVTSSSWCESDRARFP